MGSPAADIEIQLAIIRAEIEGMDDAYARMALERINALANDAVLMLPESHHGVFLAIMRAAQRG